MRLLCALIAVGLSLGACVSTTTTTTGEVPDRRPTPATPDKADVERGAQARLELASLYLSRGQTSVALDEVRKVLAAKPDLPAAYSLRGLIYASMGDPGKAEASFKRSLELAPHDGDVMHNYGWFLCQEKRYDEANAVFEKTLQQPGYREQVRTRLAQGVCEARAGHWAEAEQAMLRSYELDPSNPLIGYNLADVLLRRNELQRARFYIGRVNAVREQATSQSLWLAVRIEDKLGNVDARRDLGRQLQGRFPESPEASKFERGRFDE